MTTKDACFSSSFQLTTKLTPQETLSYYIRCNTLQLDGGTGGGVHRIPQKDQPWEQRGRRQPCSTVPPPRSPGAAEEAQPPAEQQEGAPGRTCWVARLEVRPRTDPALLHHIAAAFRPPALTPPRRATPTPQPQPASRNAVRSPRPCNRRVAARANTQTHRTIKAGK